MARRLKGEGSFSKKIINNHEYIRYTVTVKVEGKSKRMYFYGSNETECKRKYKEWKQKQAANSNNKLTFAAQYKKWLFEERQSQLKPSTFERYYGIYKNYVKTSSLSEMKLTDITKDDIKKYFKGLSKKLPITTVKNVYRYIKPFFVYAVNEELIVKDVCIYEFPKSYEVEEEEQFILLDKSQQLKFVKALKGDSMELVILLGLTCGLRLGEILALSYNDFDFDNNLISINKSLKRIPHINENGNRIYEDKVMKPKTKNSVRKVPVPEFLIPLIKQQHKANMENKLKLGKEYCDKGLLFCKENGVNIDTKLPNRHLKSILKKNNLPNIRFHDLRGIFISNCVNNNINPKVIQQLAGHSNLNVTMMHYARITKEKMIESSVTINEAFKNLF